MILSENPLFAFFWGLKQSCLSRWVQRLIYDATDQGEVYPSWAESKGKKGKSDFHINAQGNCWSEVSCSSYLKGRPLPLPLYWVQIHMPAPNAVLQSQWPQDTGAASARNGQVSFDHLCPRPLVLTFIVLSNACDCQTVNLPP